MAEEKNGRGCRQEYAELLCDFMFKRMFGSEANKDVLIGFLNMILEDVYIVDVDFISPEHLGLKSPYRSRPRSSSACFFWRKSVILHPTN